MKILWHNGVGLSLYTKRLDRGQFIWPAAVDGVVAITPLQMACLLEAIDWRNQCECEHDQTAWTVAHLKTGGAISNVSLWLAEIDRPIRLLAKAKLALRTEGLAITSIMNNVCDAAGETHDILTWKIGS